MNSKNNSLDASKNLGWKDAPKDDPTIIALSQSLVSSNGIRGLEILSPNDIEEAVRLFRRDGFVVISDVLNDEQIDILSMGCQEVITDILATDEDCNGNRGSHRYSFGGSSQTRSQLHHPAWQMLLDIPSVTSIVNAIFESSNYILRAASGDFCLPGAIDYQPLHSDVHNLNDTFYSKKIGSFHDPKGIVSLRDLPTPYLCVNFLPQEITALNGPTRQIPGTQNSRALIPSLEDEPEWMKFSTVCPAPAGAIMIRDVRAWHGGTPNLSDSVRSIPNLEFYAPWFREPMVPGINYRDYKKLSEHAQKLVRFSVADSTEELQTGVLPIPQPGQ